MWWWVRRSRKGYEKNPRYKYDNIISLDLDMPEGTTQNYIGPDMVSNVAQVNSVVVCFLGVRGALAWGWRVRLDMPLDVSVPR